MIRDSIGWAMTKERALAEHIIAHDPDPILFNQESKSEIGRNAFVKNFDLWMNPRFKTTSFDVRDLRLKFSRSGDAAWWSVILRRLPYGACCRPARDLFSIFASTCISGSTISAIS